MRFRTSITAGSPPPRPNTIPDRVARAWLTPAPALAPSPPEAVPPLPPRMDEEGKAGRAVSANATSLRPRPRDDAAAACCCWRCACSAACKSLHSSARRTIESPRAHHLDSIAPASPKLVEAPVHRPHLPPAAFGNAPNTIFVALPLFGVAFIAEKAGGARWARRRGEQLDADGIGSEGGLVFRVAAEK